MSYPNKRQGGRKWICIVRVSGGLFLLTASLLLINIGPSWAATQGTQPASNNPSTQEFPIPLEFDKKDRVFLVSAQVNHKTLRLMLDTGAGNRIAISKKAAAGLGLEDAKPSALSGVQGDEPAVLATASQVAIGPVQLSNTPVYVVQSDNFKRMDGLIGAGFLDQYRVTLFPAKRLLTLSQGGDADLNPQMPTLTEPIITKDGYLAISITVLGQQAAALIDSGADVNFGSSDLFQQAKKVLSPKDLRDHTTSKKVGFGETNRTIHYTISRVPIPVFIGDSLVVPFETTIKGGESDSIFRDPLEVDLGTPFLMQFDRVIIDYPNQTITLQYPATDSDPKTAKSPPNRVFPGYQWQRVASTWVEVPVAETMASVQTATPAAPAVTPAIPANLSKLVVNGSFVDITSGSEVTVSGNDVTVDKGGSGADLTPSDIAALVPNDYDHLVLTPFSFYMSHGFIDINVDKSGAIQMKTDGSKVIVVSAGVSYTLKTGTSVTIDGKPIAVQKAAPPVSQAGAGTTIQTVIVDKHDDGTTTTKTTTTKTVNGASITTTKTTTTTTNDSGAGAGSGTAGGPASP